MALGCLWFLAPFQAGVQPGKGQPSSCARVSSFTPLMLPLPDPQPLPLLHPHRPIVCWWLAWPGESSSTLPTWSPGDSQIRPSGRAASSPTPTTSLGRPARPTGLSGRPILGVRSARSCGYRHKHRACHSPQGGHIWDKPGLRRCRTPLRTCPHFNIWFLLLVPRAYCGGCGCRGSGQEDLGEQMSATLPPPLPQTLPRDAQNWSSFPLLFQKSSCRLSHSIFWHRAP